MTRYRIPAGTKCKIAPDDDLTPYREHRSRSEQIGELRWELDTGWVCLVLPGKDLVVQVETKYLEGVE